MTIIRARSGGLEDRRSERRGQWLSVAIGGNGDQRKESVGVRIGREGRGRREVCVSISVVGHPHVAAKLDLLFYLFCLAPHSPAPWFASSSTTNKNFLKKSIFSIGSKMPTFVRSRSCADTTFRTVWTTTSTINLLALFGLLPIAYPPCQLRILSEQR